MDKMLKVVINIPENIYRRLKAGDTNAGNTFHNTALESISNGVVLSIENCDAKMTDHKCYTLRRNKTTCDVCGADLNAVGQ